ncbi:MAG TPA: hypothetical protein EYG60_01310, partial [Campylobacterales bacterium]|nr:hypothetical protein [Campylobacterales bacterium]
MKSKSKKLKTEQMMRVQIGSFGTIEIGHKTEMGKVSQVMDMGNKLREIKGLRPLELKEILRLQDFWEFVIARDTQYFKYVLSSNHSQNTDKIGIDDKCPDSGHLKNEFINLNQHNEAQILSNFEELEKYKDKAGQIQYTELMKKFPHLIKSKRGKNGGTWAELYILLKIASMLDKDLEVEIYRVFIEEKILYFRDEGGYSFKELNKAIDKYLPSPTGNNTGRYITIAKIIREKLEITDTKGYNEKEHHAQIQE